MTTKKDLIIKIDSLKKDIEKRFMEVDEKLDLLAKKFKCKFEMEEYIDYKDYYRMFYFNDKEKVIKKRYILKQIINKNKK